MRIGFPAVAALLAIGACASPPQSADGTHQGYVTVEGRSFPLPTGEWRELGTQQIANLNPRVSAGSRQLVLYNENAGKLAGLIQITASGPSPSPLSWLEAGRQWTCQDGQPSLGPTLRNVEIAERFECRRLSAFNPRTWRINPDWTQLKPFADRRAAEPSWVPARLVFAQFTAGDPRGSMTVSYSFDPALPAASVSPVIVPGEADRLQRWADSASPLVARGFNGLSTSPAPAF